MSKPRYSRHNLIPAWNQDKLAKAKVAVVGCGALGNEVLKNLALLGVGQIWVVDYDFIEIHNLTRSVLFREADIGRLKTEVVAQRVKELNPDVCVHQIHGKLELAFGRGLLREMKVVFGCLDSIGARRELNKRCYFAGVPWIDGGISHYSGNVALFDPRAPETACYRCKMNSSHWELLNEKYSCGYLKDNYQEKTIVTTIMTSSVIAAYMVEIGAKLLLGEGKFQPGTQLFIPLSRPIGFQSIQFTLNQECPDHSVIPQDEGSIIQKVSFENTPLEVAQKLGLGDNWQLELPFDFVSKLTCYTCGSIESIRIPKHEIKQSQIKCPQCGENSREPTEYFRISMESEDANQPFSYFGLCSREIVEYIDNNQRFSVEIIC